MKDKPNKVSTKLDKMSGKCPEKLRPYYDQDGITIYHGDCLEIMPQFPDKSFDLVVTSPPYNVQKSYAEYKDNQPSEMYFDMIGQSLCELYRITKVGGRLCLNAPFIGNSMFLKKSSNLCFYPIYFIDLAKRNKWIFRDFAIWVKTREAENPNNFCGNATSWGSWLSPSSPYLRCFAEIIIIFHKKNKKLQHKGMTDLTKDKFLEYTKNVWYFPSEVKRFTHPTPFPEELPKRCIKLFTWKFDCVLDPFMGIGTSLIAAKKLGRRAVGIEISQEYCDIAVERIKKEIAQQKLF